jgi:xylulose-5-phosphate/fructose-6-phosphate phosphoketolase
MHQAMAATLEHCVTEIKTIQRDARSSRADRRPRWTMIVLRSPKGWTAPEHAGGHHLEGFWRTHQVPLPDVKKNPEQFAFSYNGCADTSPESSSTAAESWLPS